ncbi:hypothetical protein, partial [Mycoplana dimorpha]|uniref:hypothetical protein n=1 Tax=Mycoplana dimorpha TaxID=28320 RepID=UPI001AECB11F
APPPSLVRRFLGPTPNQVNSQNDGFAKILAGLGAMAWIAGFSTAKNLHPRPLRPVFAGPP